MSKAHRLKPRLRALPALPTLPTLPENAENGKNAENASKSKALPLNFLLGCSDTSLDNFELARLNEVANLRNELHLILDRMIDTMSQAALAAWFKSQDRARLQHAIENEETAEEWAKRMIREGQRSAEELLPLPALEPGVAHRAASIRYQQRNLAEGKCRCCPKPLARNSVEHCEEHLAKARAREQQKKALALPGSTEYLYAGKIEPSGTGRTPGTLASLAMNRENATRALLTELGIKPEHAAVSLKAAKEALLAAMPDKAHAKTQAELFEKAGVITKTTGQKALKALLAEGKIQRTGKGGMRDVYRYFAHKD